MKLVIEIHDVAYEAICKYPNYFNDSIQEAIRNGIPLTESDDCVNRETVIETLKDVFDEYEAFLIGVCGQLPIKCVKAIYSLPSVQPKRDKGEWIPIKNLKDIPQGKEILVCDCDGLIKIGYAVTYRFKGFDKEDDIRVSDSGGDRIKGIVAYMPLPKPYKPQESEE